MALVKIRMLVDHPIEGVEYSANQVVELDEKLAKPLVKKGGPADDSDDAVKYCIGSGVKPVKHVKPKPQPSEEGGKE